LFMKDTVVSISMNRAHSTSHKCAQVSSVSSSHGYIVFCITGTWSATLRDSNAKLLQLASRSSGSTSRLASDHAAHQHPNQEKQERTADCANDDPSDVTS